MGEINEYVCPYDHHPDADEQFCAGLSLLSCAGLSLLRAGGFKCFFLNQMSLLSVCLVNEASARIVAFDRITNAVGLSFDRSRISGSAISKGSSTGSHRILLRLPCGREEQGQRGLRRIGVR